jgi:predicted lipid-binding transport protein (Tim44 family)
MMYGANTFGLILAIILLIIMYSALPITVGFVVFWIIRTLKKNKKAQGQKAFAMDDLCLNCGAAIDSKQQACQKCGWTWK